ncbi:MAG TPA: 5-formyltetrahydrofolate cyclo-ligase [Chloroflexota bacterium]|nr:5-formyltetrahydrofolate cyclo-ligase [Chloroflexota bacterium]
MSSAAELKAAARQRVWQLLEEQKLARFPRPVRGRIPNFAGSEVAERRLAALPEFEAAGVVKVNPDAPQRMVRYAALKAGKTLLTPTPRLREGFLCLEPAAIPAGNLLEAASIAGAAKYGRAIALPDIPAIDLLVVGSVAVTEAGARAGKGEGYGELEYAMLRMFGKVRPDTPVVTSIHEAQLVAELPFEPFDVPVELIVTPERVIRTQSRQPKPDRIYWELLPEEKLAAIPLLQELARTRESPR